MSSPLATESDVTAAYRLILDRERAPGEGARKVGMPCNSLFREFLFSDEFVNRRLYYLRESLIQDFTRNLTPYIDQYRAVLRRFRGGEKLSATADSDHAEFLAVAFLVLLRRIPDPMGFLWYLNRLDGGHETREDLIRGIAESEEAQAIGESTRFFADEATAGTVPEMFDLPDPDRSEDQEAGEGGPSQLVIVSGPPRSGTTVLAALLNAHPRICVTYESRIFSLSQQLARSLFVLSPSRASVFDPVVELAQQHVPAVVRGELSRLRKYRLVVNRPRRQVYRIGHPGPPPLIVGDKNPAYLAEAAWTALDTSRAFPEAKWVLIFRDPQAVCNSQLRLGMAASSDEACRGYRHCLENARQLHRALGPEQCFITTHDRLFAEPTYVKEAARLAAFLDFADGQAFRGFVASQLSNPAAFSRASDPKPKQVSRPEVEAFFAEQEDAPVFAQLIADLGLWNDASECASAG